LFGIFANYIWDSVLKWTPPYLQKQKI